MKYRVWVQIEKETDDEQYEEFGLSALVDVFDTPEGAESLRDTIMARFGPS